MIMHLFERGKLIN